MGRLFCIATNQFTIYWERVREQDPALLARSLPVLGRLRLIPVSPKLLILPQSSREGSSSRLAADVDFTGGPPLFEQTEYKFFARCVNPGGKLQIRHRDPLIEQSLSSQDSGQIAYGVINFRNQIGRSLFSVYLNGQRQLDFEVEVFPTKIDYESDYQDILADTQSILTSLAYEYLRSTYQLSKSAPGAAPSRLEWLVLIEEILADLEKAILYISRRPVRGLRRSERKTRVERIHKIDSRIRSQVRRGRGHGALFQLGQIQVHEQLSQRPPELTLDTLEHRWLRNQLEDVQRTLGILTSYFLVNEQQSKRRTRSLEIVNRIKSRVARLLGLEPIEQAGGEVPAGFASLQLISAPGYREAYRLLLFLRMGLRLEGDLFKLALKDLDVLYEYWSYLTVTKIVRDELGSPQDLGSFFKLGLNSFGVQLKRGESQRLTFQADNQRKVSVLYNPKFADQETTLIPQKPDILIRIEDDGWPQMQLVCDAKYRVDATVEYKKQFGAHGPPVDALNVLHRYRDAILELDDGAFARQPLKRSVVQAAALFPLNLVDGEVDFRDSRLWRSIEKIGVGAIPLLPSNTALLQEWLLRSLRRGGWSLADRAIASLADERARDWRIAASEPVLMGVLRSPGAKEHLAWIKRYRLYYQPWTKSQGRQFAVKQVVIYVPSGLDEPNGIRYVADVEQFEVVDREEISTPWPTRREGKTILYKLGPLRPLDRPIELLPNESMTPKWRWTTRLSLQRAKSLTELGLETEPEWRLLEHLRANGVKPDIKLVPPNLQSAENPKGRAWFKLPSGEMIRFDGSNGFISRTVGTAERYYTLEEVFRRLP
ncbi:MAG: DUF2357 domain-containing protein [bacterium]|jgi:hypothetical protein